MASASQENDENIGLEHNPLHRSDDRMLPEVYHSEDNRRRSLLHNIGDSNPEEEMKTLNDMFKKFRPVGNKKKMAEEAQDHDDAALFAYMERRSSTSYGRGDSGSGRRGSTSYGRGDSGSGRRGSISSILFDRRISRDSTSAMSSSSDQSERGSFSSIFGNIRRISTPDLTEESALQVLVKKCPCKKGNAVYRRGRIAAADGEWEQAVQYYHVALVKQRAYYGEDHLNVAKTLSCLGMALIELGEYFSAITALEECLFIFQKVLGPGAEECVSATNNIRLALDRSKQQNS